MRIYKLFSKFILLLYLIALTAFCFPVKSLGEETLTCRKSPELKWQNATPNNVAQLNSEMKFFIENSDPPRSYSFNIWIKDKKSGDIYNYASMDLSASDLKSPIFVFSPNTVGEKSIYALYINKDNGPCHGTETNTINFTVSDNKVNSANITLSAPSTINQGNNARIEFSFQNLSDWLAVLLINKGGKDCIDSTNDNCWVNKWEATLGSNNYSDGYNWSTSASTILGPYPVKLKVFNATTYELKTTTINVCDSKGKNCGSTGSESGGGGEGEEGTDDGSGGGGNTESTNIGTFTNLNRTLKWFLTGSDTGGKDMSNAELTDVQGVVERTTQYALDVAGVIAVIIIIYSALMYATAFGEESKAEAAKKALTWSIIGMLVVIFSKALMLFINSRLKTGFF